MIVSWKTFGLDMSLTSSGVSWELEISSGLITVATKPKDFDCDLDRLLHIVNQIGSRIPNDVNLVCVENYFTPSNRAQIGAAISLVQLGVLMRIHMYQRKIPFLIVAPAQLKKFATGSGSSQKSMIIKEVYKRWNVDAKDDNQADAFVLNKIAQELCRTQSHQAGSITKTQEDVIKKLLAEAPRYNWV